MLVFLVYLNPVVQESKIPILEYIEGPLVKSPDCERHGIGFTFLSQDYRPFAKHQSIFATFYPGELVNGSEIHSLKCLSTVIVVALKTG